MKLTKPILILISFAVAAIGITGGWLLSRHKTNNQRPPAQQTQPLTLVTNYTDCLKQSSSKLLGTYPEQCTFNSQTFVNPDQNAAAAPSAPTGSGYGPVAPSLDESVSDLMPDVACRTHYMNKGETISTENATVFYGDFNNDAVQDAVIGVAIDGTGKYGHVCVYTAKAGALVLLWELPDSDILAFGKPQSYTATAFHYFGAKTYSGASTVPDATYTYTWSGTTFVKS